MLSTGRVGTKFMEAAFADQGYRAFHENLYDGEPGSAIILYTQMLGDMWFRDRAAYYALDSDFARPYVKAVLDAIDTGNNTHRVWKNGLFSRKVESLSDRVVIHTGHRLTAATPLVQREAEKQGLTVKTLILFRNPIKTIHAIYNVESPPGPSVIPYRNRPASFFGDSTYRGAADIWANTYLMAQDQSIHLGNGNYRLLNLEKFSNDYDYAKDLFEFLNLPFQEERYHKFLHQILNQPLRSSKVDSTRNSHIFHDPKFSFSDNEIAEIYKRVKTLLSIYGINWDKAINEYKVFHQQEKQEIGFV